jgi:hypothetical protein
MAQSKIEVFTAMLAEQPDNAMIWYGLASEQYKVEKLGRGSEGFAPSGEPQPGLHGRLSDAGHDPGEE